MLPDDPLTTGTPADAAALRALLQRVGYTSSGLALAFAVDDAARLLIADLPLFLPRRDEHDPRATLARLFLLGEVLPERAIAAALEPLPLAALCDTGVAAAAGGEVTALVKLHVYQNLWFACDFNRGGAVAPNHVMAVNASSLGLAYFTVRRAARRALDLGSGCGVQALLAAAHSAEVVGTDVNRRAVNMARFNAWLNGLDHVDFREGSLFEPVAGESFDLVVSSPPLVVSPDTSFVYRDGGLPGDSFCAAVVRGTPGVLAPGGFGHVLVNWAVAEGQDDDAAPRAWLEGAGCDALLLRHKVEDPLSYARRWVAQESEDAAGFRATVARWLHYYDANGIRRLGSGALLMRARAGANWMAVYPTPPADLQPSGEQLLRLFAAQDFLSSLARPEDLLDRPLRPAPQHTVEQVLALADGAYEVRSARVRLHDGLPFAAEVDGLALALLASCDGTTPLGSVVEAVAAGAGVDPDGIAGGALSLATELVSLGFLLPA